MVELRACDGMLHNNMGGQSTQFIDHVLRLIGNFVGNSTGTIPAASRWVSPGWPASGGVAGLIYQQMYVQWIKRAYDGGQRIMVAAALNNQLLQRIIRNGSDAQYQSTSPYTVPNATLDFEACKMQTIMMKGFRRKTARGWRWSQHRRRRGMPFAETSSRSSLPWRRTGLNSIDQVQELYNLGVRTSLPST